MDSFERAGTQASRKEERGQGSTIQGMMQQFSLIPSRTDLESEIDFVSRNGYLKCMSPRRDFRSQEGKKEEKSQCSSYCVDKNGNRKSWNTYGIVPYPLVRRTRVRITPHSRPRRPVRSELVDAKEGSFEAEVVLY